MPFTSRFEFDWGIAPGVTAGGSFDAASARILAARDGFEEICREEIQNAMDDSMQILLEEWEAIAPVQTGAYKAGIRTRTVTLGPDTVFGEVWNEMDYAGFVEGGTKHGGMWGYIYPNKKFLKIPSDRLKSTPNRSFIYAKRVKGQKAQHVLRQAHLAAKPWMTRQFHLAATRAKARTKAML